MSSTSSCATIAVSSPCLPLFPRKMSAKRELMTTLKPQFIRAHTACSRLDPVPKSGPATRTEPSAYTGLLRRKDSSLRQAAKRPSSKPVRVTRLRYSAGMIWSVSTLLRRSGTPTPVWLVNFSMSVAPNGDGLQVGWRGQGAADGGRRRDRHGDQVRATTLALAAFEVAVGGRGAALAGRDRVRVHA